MELDSSLPWLALALTPGLASRLSARLLKRFGSPDAVFRARLTDLEACSLPAPVAQAVFKKESFKRAEKELKAARNIDRCRLINWSDPEYPQTLLQIYDPPVLLYVRGGAEVLNLPSLSIVGTRRPTLYGTQMAERLGRELAARGLVIVAAWRSALTPSGIKAPWPRMGELSASWERELTFATRRRTKSCTTECWSGARSSVSSRYTPIRHPRIFPCVLSRACHSARSWSNTVDP